MKLPKQAQPVVRDVNASEKMDGTSGVYPSAVDPISLGIIVIGMLLAAK